MMKKYLFLILLLTLPTLMLSIFTSKAAQIEKQGNLLAVRSCDGRKTIFVEGFKEGEKMTREKAQVVAKLLMNLMKICDQEVVARLKEDNSVIVLNDATFILPDLRSQKTPVLLAHGGQPHTKKEIKLFESEEKRVIDEGYKVFHDSSIGTNGISCDMCHPDASNTHAETYPKFQTQLKKVATLREMINWCIENPLEGAKLKHDDPKMIALEAYITSVRKGKTLEPGKH